MTQCSLAQTKLEERSLQGALRPCKAELSEAWVYLQSLWLCLQALVCRSALVLTDHLLPGELRPLDLSNWGLGDGVCTTVAFLIPLAQTVQLCCGQETYSRHTRGIYFFQTGFVFHTAEQVCSVLVRLFYRASTMGESLLAAIQVLCKRRMKLARFRGFEVWGIACQFFGFFSLLEKIMQQVPSPLNETALFCYKLFVPIWKCRAAAFQT